MMKYFSGRFLAMLAVLAGTLAVSTLAEPRRVETLARPLSAIPDRIGVWTGTAAEALPAAVLGKLRATSYVSRTYRGAAGELGLFIAYYARQHAGESMHSPKQCLPGGGWEIWDYGSATVTVGGRRVTVNRYSIQNAGRRATVLYWYQSRQRIIASEYLAKVLLVRDALVEGSTAGSLVRITFADRPAMLSAGLQFAEALIPEVQHCFGETAIPAIR